MSKLPGSEFFRHSQRVASAPHTFFWNGELGAFFGGLAILGKIPNRLYVGLEEIERRKVDVDEELIVKGEGDSFSRVRLDPALRTSLETILRQYFPGSRLHLLSEIRLGGSLGFLGALAASLAKLTQARGSDQALLPLALEAGALLQGSHFVPATIAASLLPSPYPIVVEKSGRSVKAQPLNRLFPDLPSQPNWPIDLALIYSGSIVSGESVLRATKTIRDRLGATLRAAQKALGKRGDGGFWKTALDMSNFLTAQTLLALRDLFLNGPDESTLRNLFSSINHYQNLLRLFEATTPAIDAVYSAVHREANLLDNRVGSGAKLTGVGKGGDVLVALPYGNTRERIEEAVGNLRDALNASMALDWTSWREGFESDGVRLEQDIGQGLVHRSLGKDLFVLKVFNGEDRRTLLLEEREIEVWTKKLDLFLDGERERILLKGEPITAKDLPSQKAAIQILRSLLDHRELSSSKLPETYAKSRYDLQSKVTTPLSRLVAQRLSQRLDFDISGTSFENYTLRLKRAHPSIGILQFAAS